MIGELCQLAQGGGGGTSIFLGVGWGGGVLVVVPAAVHVGQLLEARAPVVEVVVVLVAGAGGVERADRASGGATALVVEHQQRVIGRSRGVVICRPQALPERTPQEG